MWACEIHGLYSWLDQPRRAVNSSNFGHVWKSFAGPDDTSFATGSFSAPAAARTKQSLVIDAWRRNRKHTVFGEPGGARTRDHRIKSAMLYQLSYRPWEEGKR